MTRILIIDDEPSIAELLSEVLTKVGCSVATASNGWQGLQRLKRAEFDVVVTDMCMPGIDGAGVVDYVRQSNRPETPVIGISGTPRLLEETTCDAVLSKPFPLHALIDNVKQLTGTAPRVAHAR